MVIDGQLLCVHSRTGAGGGCSGASLCVCSRMEAGGGHNRACPARRALCVCTPERKQEAGADVHALHLLPAAVWAPLSRSTAPTPTSTQVSGPDLGPDDVPIIAPLLAGPRFCVSSPCGSAGMQLCSLAPSRFRVLAVPHLGSSASWQFILAVLRSVSRLWKPRGKLRGLIWGMAARPRQTRANKSELAVH